MDGGSEITIKNISSILSNYNIRVSVLTPKFKGLLEEEQFNNVKIYRFGNYNIDKARFFSPPLRDLYFDRAINEIIKDKNIDIIHYHNMHFLSSSPFEIDFPSVLTVHDHWPFCMRGSLYHRLLNYPRPICKGTSLKCYFCHIEKRELKLRKLNPFYPYLIYKYNIKRLNNLSNIVAPSNYMKEFLIRNNVDAEKISVIRNGIDTNLFAPKNKKKRQVLFVGRLSRYKGLNNLVKAFKLLNIKDVKLIIVGGIKCYETNGGKIIYTGKLPQDKLVSLYSSSICTIVPSICPENCPLVVLESMSCGTPVIGSNLGGIPELIRDGENGFLVNPYDISDICDKLEMVLSQDELTERMSENSRKFALEHFKLEDCVKRYIELYKKSIEDYPN
jgi:glycosyltransferase involved in cell wall biosynthesis